MQARCNRCLYTWRLRVHQTSCRRCPKCRSYDIDYLQWGTPVLPKRHIPHETGDTFIWKRVNPLLHRWEAALQSADTDLAGRLYEEVGSMLQQAKRLNADETELAIAKMRRYELYEQMIAAIRDDIRRLRQGRLHG